MKNSRTHPDSQPNETYISQNTTITGSLNTDSNIAFDGRIEGSLTAGGDVHITGTVVGDVSGQDITLSEGRVKGNLSAKGDMAISRSMESPSSWGICLARTSILTAKPKAI